MAAKNDEEEIVYEAWTFKKSKHFGTSRKRWTVLSTMAKGETVKVETWKDQKRTGEPTESFELSHLSCVVLKEDPTKFRIFLDGVQKGYRSFTTANSELASIWCAAIGKVINDLAASKELAKSEVKIGRAKHPSKLDRGMRISRAEVLESPTIFEESNSEEEKEPKFVVARPVGKSTWDANSGEAEKDATPKNVKIVTTEYGFKAIAIPSTNSLGPPPPSASLRNLLVTQPPPATMAPAAAPIAGSPDDGSPAADMSPPTPELTPPPDSGGDSDTPEPAAAAEAAEPEKPEEKSAPEAEPAAAEPVAEPAPALEIPAVGKTASGALGKDVRKPSKVVDIADPVDEEDEEKPPTG